MYDSVSSCVRPPLRHTHDFSCLVPTPTLNSTIWSIIGIWMVMWGTCAPQLADFASPGGVSWLSASSWLFLFLSLVAALSAESLVDTQPCNEIMKLCMNAILLSQNGIFRLKFYWHITYCHLEVLWCIGVGEVRTVDRPRGCIKSFSWFVRRNTYNMKQIN